ncbi:hypothetical protein [Kribbella sp. NPDC051137]|uniref:hypothetical protein n=1 Tax=Kribbella sp. NPDC051137 TaxID=3155045 RepID=UPI0034160C33
MNIEEMQDRTDAVYESLRALNHATLGQSLPAPVVYELLGSLKQAAGALSQLARQLGHGLERSLITYDVYDDNRDPAVSVAMAVHALTVAADQSHHTGNALATAQSAINLQGYNLPSVAEVTR